jgi:arginine decarboxylase
MDQFIDLHDVKDTLELHAFNGKPYYIGVFLVGAYQEILGDLHNLFGDTNAIHVSRTRSSANSAWTASSRATRSTEVLGYVQYGPRGTSVRACARVGRGAARRAISFENPPFSCAV